MSGFSFHKVILGPEDVQCLWCESYKFSFSGPLHLWQSCRLCTRMTSTGWKALVATSGTLLRFSTPSMLMIYAMTWVCLVFWLSIFPSLCSLESRGVHAKHEAVPKWCWGWAGRSRWGAEQPFLKSGNHANELSIVPWCRSDPRSYLHLLNYLGYVNEHVILIIRKTSFVRSMWCCRQDLFVERGLARQNNIAIKISIRKLRHP